MLILILAIFLILYGIYEKHCETKQIISISKVEGLTFQQLSDLIDKIKK